MVKMTTFSHKLEQFSLVHSCETSNTLALKNY